MRYKYIDMQLEVIKYGKVVIGFTMSLFLLCLVTLTVLDNRQIMCFNFFGFKIIYRLRCLICNFKLIKTESFVNNVFQITCNYTFAVVFHGSN